MGVHGGRARGHIEIVAEIIGGDLVGDLDQPAFKADLRVEREGRLILGDVARPDEGLRRRVIAHREKQIRIGREAGAALSRCRHRLGRTEARRVGKECVSTCRSRGSLYYSTKKTQSTKQ